MQKSGKTNFRMGVCRFLLREVELRINTCYTRNPSHDHTESNPHLHQTTPSGPLYMILHNDNCSLRFTFIDSKNYFRPLVKVLASAKSMINHSVTSLLSLTSYQQLDSIPTTLLVPYESSYSIEFVNDFQHYTFKRLLLAKKPTKD